MRRILQRGVYERRTTGIEDAATFTAVREERAALRTFMRLSCTGASHLSQLKRLQRARNINKPQKSCIRR